jgi:2-hydroxy-3-keto-5-methylthiopentenyl-1-phosphate phosphatase
VENALVSDFDGTVTRVDFYTLIAERYMPQPPTDFLELYRQGQMSHFDAMASYYAHAPADEDSLAALLRDTEPDSQLADAVARLAAASWELILVSAGSTWYIDRILAAAGVHATVYSNPGRIEPGRGLILERATAAPFYSADVGVDKAAVVEDALSRYRKVAFAGDGPPDLEAALLVEPDLRFARGYLAEELRKRGEPFRAFERWSEIADALL